MVAEGTVYTLFADYGAWRRRAEETEGKEDDAFFDLCIRFFPEDSIAYFFPAYFIQTWDYGGTACWGGAFTASCCRGWTGSSGKNPRLLQKFSG
ncbi:MAG: hypothetical protein IPJ00_21435 [Saprospirales bacterium]|nr:hypothetical protein [Saprospirales bacterium]